jgi:DNA-binding transcriptional ArsR family regulator
MTTSFFLENYMEIWLYCHIPIEGDAIMMMDEHEHPPGPDALDQHFCNYIRKIRSDKELYKLKAQVAKALAHESRLMIIDALNEKDMCVGELTEMVGVDQSTVSKHLSVLKQAGIVLDRKEGSNKIYYHLRMAIIRQFSDLAMALIHSNVPRAGFHALREAKDAPKERQP